MHFLTHVLLRPVLAAALIVSFAAAPVAFAHKDDDKSSEKVKKANTEVSVQINHNGKTLVRGAEVSAVSGSVITASTKWGSSTLVWTINTSGSTQFVQNGGKNKNGSLSSVAMGDVISFSGTLNASSTGLVVAADAVKNWTKKVTTTPNVKDTFQGTLQSVASTTLPTSLVLKIDNTNYTVQASSSTIVIGSNWMPTTLSTFVAGDIVRVFGSISASNNTVINAIVIRNASR